MNMNFKQLKLEFLRLFGIRGNLILFLFYSLICLFFVYSGTVAHKTTLREKQLFSQHERDKSKLYVRYDQYGDFGFRILHDAQALNIFFTNSGVFENLHSNVDMAEVIDINSSYKGRNLFFKKGFFKDMAGFFFLFGSLFMLYMGMTAYKNRNRLLRFSGTVFRLLLLELAFSLLLTLLYLFPGILGIVFTGNGRSLYIYFCIYLLIFLAFFYTLGLLMRTLIKKPSSAYLVGLAVWFVSVFIIPEIATIHLHKKASSLLSTEAHNLMKLRELLTYEKDVHTSIKDIQSLTLAERKKIYAQKVKDFMESGYLRNNQREKKLNQDVRDTLVGYEKALMAFPSGFYPFLSGEMSGRGYWDYVDLVDYTINLRHEFVKFYLEKRYRSVSDTIIPFVKNGENVFRRTGRLPQRYWIALGLTFVYIALLFLASYLRLTAVGNRAPQSKKPGYQFRGGNTYFILCKDDTHKRELFRSYQSEPSTLCIDNINTNELDLGIKPVHMADYYYRVAGGDSDKFNFYLRLLGVPSLKTLPDNIPPETIQSVYCAAVTAGNGDTIVIDDFLKGKSRDLERRFLQLVTQLNEEQKIVIYLGCEIFLTSPPFQGNIKIDSYKSFKIDPRVVSLR